MKKNSLLIASVAFGLVFFQVAQAQQPQRRIGFLTGGGNRFSFDAFMEGLRELGYTDGKNIIVEFRSAEGNQGKLPDLVAELVQLKVDVLVTTSPGVRVARQTTQTIPIVMVTQEDPVAAGFVSTLAHPGGNITGVTSLSRDLSSKRLGLLMEVMPKISRIGVLWDASDKTNAAVSFKEYEDAAPAWKAQIHSLEVRGPTPDLEGAFHAALKRQVGAVIAIRNFLFNRYGKKLAELAVKHRLPAMYERSDYVQAGGLMSYSSGDAENYRRAAYYVDRILKGAKPADLPVEQPTKFEFVVNVRAAKQIGMTIRPDILALATKIIK